MRRSLILFAAVGLTVSSANAQPTVSTGKSAVGIDGGENGAIAHLYKGTGLIHYQIYPGLPTSPFLSFPQKSFVTFTIGGSTSAMRFTNNDVGYNLPPNYQRLTDAVVTKINDTIRCVWQNKAGCDLIQEIFPVKLDNSVQMILRWKVTNTTTQTTSVSVQYLHDLLVDGNDSSPILTNYGYSNKWVQYLYNGTVSIPSYYASFRYSPPNPPTFDVGTTGLGYLDTTRFSYGSINLKRLTIGDWTNLVVVPIGPPSPLPTGSFNDVGMLFEFNDDTIPPGTTKEIGRISYGTAEFSKCVGELFGISFSNRKVQIDLNKPAPTTFTIDMVMFNPDKNTSSDDTYITLVAGSALKIVSPQPVSQNGKVQRQPVGTNGKILPLGSASASWQVQVDPSQITMNEFKTQFGFIAESPKFGSPIFTNPNTGSDTCAYAFTVMVVPKRLDEQNPLVESVTKIDEFNYELTVSDRQLYDSGLTKVNWTTVSGDSANFHVTVSPPISRCSKSKHTITVYRDSSTKGGCGYLSLTDCYGRTTDTMICFNAVPQWYPDTIPPRTHDTLIHRTRAVIFANDNFAIDTGIKSVTLLDATVSHVSVTTVPSALDCERSIVIITVSAPDTIGEGCAFIAITDCADNTSIDTICFAPLLSISSIDENVDLELIGNPASTTVTARIRLPEPAAFDLKVVDLIGRTVAALNRLRTNAAVTDVILDVKTLPTGSYYLILETPTHQLARMLKIIR